MATAQPSPSAPISRLAGTRTSSKKHSASSARPLASLIGRTVTPGMSTSTRIIDRPRCRLSGVPVRTSMTMRVAVSARLVQILCPEMTYSSPSLVARQRSAARSLPASDSEKPCPHQASPDRNSGRYSAASAGANLATG